MLLILPLVIASRNTVQAQQVTELFTDFGGYWRSGTTSLNSTYPNTSHNVVAFKIGTDTFSTGVNNALLTSHGVAYKPGNYKALPISSIGGNVSSGGSVYAAVASLYDGVAAGYSTPVPSARMKDLLTDGINGLDIGTGVTNVPATGTMTYTVDSINIAAVTDNKPDILYTQIADPSSTLDVLYFVNSLGVMVGNSVSVNWSSVGSVGTYYLDLYNFLTGVSCNTSTITSGNTINTTRNIRMSGYRFSDFGITSANSGSVTMLIIKPGGQSDPAFVAYNADAFILRTPVITLNPLSQIICPNLNQNAIFSVIASGSGLSYQWKKNGVNIAGATASSYTVVNVTASDAGYYEVVVTNTSGSATSSIAYLNTSITSQPVASQKIATGNSVTLSVLTNNATGFQWKKGGVDIAGATTASYTINPLTSSDGGTYTVSVLNNLNLGCASVLSSPAVITATTILYSKGVGNINLPATWGVYTDGTGSTPVNFLRTEHTFVLANRTTASTLSNLTIAGTLDVKNGIATITPGTTLDAGAVIRTGTGALSGSSTSGLIARGNSNLYFESGNQVLGDLTITNGTITMLTSLSIGGGTLPGKVNLSGGTLALNGNQITLKSTTSVNTAMVTALGSGAAISYGSGGAFVVERFVPALRAYRLLSSPVTTSGSIKSNWMEGVNNTNTSVNLDPYPGYGTHIAGAGGADSGFDATHTNNPSLAVYNSSAQTWQAITNTNGTIQAGKAYRLMIRGSRDVNLNRNNATPSNTVLRTTGTLATGNITFNSSVISPVIGSYSLVGNPYACPVNWNTLTKTTVSSTYFGWDPFGATRGKYVSFNGLTNVSSSSTSPLDANIQSGQAFFVLTTGTTPSLQFQESSKSASNTAIFKTSDSLTKLYIQLLSDNGQTSKPQDELAVVFDDRFSDKVGDEDSYKPANPDENICISRGAALLSIEGRPAIKNIDTLPLKLWQFRKTVYQLKFVAAHFPQSTSAFLIDNYLKNMQPINLSDSTILPFNITSDSGSFAANRFMVVLHKPLLASIHHVGAVDTITSKVKSNFRVYPNPVKGNMLCVQLHNLGKGTYVVSLNDLAGWNVLKTFIFHKGGTTIEKITFGKQVTKGMYKMHLGNGSWSSSQTVLVD